MRFSHVVLVAALAASISCDDASGPKPVDLTGRWEGDLRGSVLTINLSQYGTQLTGTGTLGAEEPFTATGTFTDPIVSLTINRAPYTGITLSGQQHDGTSISAFANGYLLNNVPVVLTRRR